MEMCQFFTPILDEVLEDIEGGRFSVQVTLVAGAWTEREKMYHGGSFFEIGR